MLRVDVRRDTAIPLGVRDDMQAERGLTARLRSVDLGDASARDTTHADRRIEIDRTGRDCLDADLLIRAKRMIEPFPQLFSICAMARFNAFFLSSCKVDTAMFRSSSRLVVVRSGHAA
jgi:hypothetical protein